MKGVQSQAISSSAVVWFTPSAFPRDQLSGLCGQHGAVSCPEGLREHSITSNSQSSCSLCDQYGLFPSTGLPQPSPKAAQLPDEGLCEAAPRAKAAR